MDNLIKNYKYDDAKLLVNNDATGEMLLKTIQNNPYKNKDKWYDFINFLIDNGADVNYDNGKPICEAVFLSDLKLTKLLVERGADIHTRDDLVSQMANGNTSKKMNKYLLEEHNIKVEKDACVLLKDEFIDWDDYDSNIIKKGD